ncbi:hypothetical protein CCUS01_01775 [Colletotrichum cuscutae]|uniref:Uncharacterized protein n=1 Tax=Colletotrichum cuscutae TaxID=1209917 RepID=A0AAI9UJW5_9PEZI|nr:hypothetical protein CCUS01_01775 [Colletotrichum cuscutae]
MSASTSTPDAKMASSMNMSSLGNALSVVMDTKDPKHKVFELVFDYLLKEAEQKTDSILYWTSRDPTPDAKSRLTVFDQVDYAALGNRAPQRKRFRIVGILNQIDRRSRIKFKLVFRPWEMIYVEDAEPGFVRVGWICPTRDHFLIFVGERESIPHLYAALMRPRPANCLITHSIQSVRIFITELYRYAYGKDFEAILQLPNLKQVAIDVGVIRILSTPKRKRHQHNSELPLDSRLFPSLIEWERKYRQEMKPVWAKLQQKDIKLVCYAPGAGDVELLELIRKNDGSVRMKFLDPVCHCYDNQRHPVILAMKADNGGQLNMLSRDDLARGGEFRSV